jgi:hypothetical protein
MASRSKDEKKDKSKGREVITSGDEVRCNLLGKKEYYVSNRAISSCQEIEILATVY